MKVDVNTIAILLGVIVNIAALVSFYRKHERITMLQSTKHENRLTKIETIVTILAARAGIHARETDHLNECEDK